MQTKRNWFLNAAPMIFAVLLIAALSLWASPCSGQLELANGNFTLMKCVYTVKAAKLIAAALFVVALENLAKKRIASFTYIGFGLALFLITFAGALGIGICAKPDMACHTSALWIRIFGVLTILDGVVAFFWKDRHSL